MKTLTELTEEYLQLIRRHHYKDSDCHFYVTKFYSYGNKPYYQFEHYGYVTDVNKVWDDQAPTRETEAEAEEDMRQFLEYAIKTEIEYENEN